MPHPYHSEQESHTGEWKRIEMLGVSDPFIPLIGIERNIRRLLDNRVLVQTFPRFILCRVSEALKIYAQLSAQTK